MFSGVTEMENWLERNPVDFALKSIASSPLISMDIVVTFQFDFMLWWRTLVSILHQFVKKSPAYDKIT